MILLVPMDSRRDGPKSGARVIASPAWAALIAIADQGRNLAGKGSLDGPTQTLPALYTAPHSDFTDIVTGDNGFPAEPGYDLATGLGTPVANLLVSTLVAVPALAKNFAGYEEATLFESRNQTNFTKVTVASVPAMLASRPASVRNVKMRLRCCK